MGWPKSLFGFFYPNKLLWSTQYLAVHSTIGQLWFPNSLCFLISNKLPSWAFPSLILLMFSERKVKVKSLTCVWLFVTPWTVVYQATLSMEFSRQDYWSGLTFPPPGDLPNPGIEPRSPTVQADALQSTHITVNLLPKIVEDSYLVSFISRISSTLLEKSPTFLLFVLPTSWFVNFLVPQTPKSSIQLSQKLRREGHRVYCSAPHPLYLCFCLSLILFLLEKNKIRKDCIHMAFVCFQSS